MCSVDKIVATGRYQTRVAESIPEGWVAVEIFRIADVGETLLGRIVYWDAVGQLYYEMGVGEIPLKILEEAILEAKLLVGINV